MKPLRIIMTGCKICVALLLVIGLVLSLVAPSSREAAKGFVAGKGWQQEQLSLLLEKTSNHPFGGSAHVEFTAKGRGDTKVIRVDLVRPAYSPNWRISAYNDSTAKSE